VSIRARNAGLLFATCYDSSSMERLKSLNGKLAKVGVDAGGEVFFEAAPEADAGRKTTLTQSRPISLHRRSFTAFAVSAQDFTEENVGGKSIHLARLQGKIPQSIELPSSVALPFGVFEKVIGDTANRAVAEQYNKLVESLGSVEVKELEKTLAGLRETVLGLAAPDELVSSLRATMKAGKLHWPQNWENAWMCIKQVWGSKWNERAFFSRKAMSIPHQDLCMAVLIQEVVEAEYSFVIHTANPVTGNRNEIYAEVVRGLFGHGLIFRSDSNGEDLAYYAGAGLYDSVMLPEPRKVVLDYSEEPLFWDSRFRKDLLASIADIGQRVEKIMGSPQDIEGACCNSRYFVLQTRPQVGLD
jgi:alpha-glucan,water dikinase